MELVNRAQNFLFLNQILLDSTPHNFTKILQIEWIWVRSLKFETVRIQYLSDVFGLLSSRNFAATMVTWRNDFSSLLIFQKKKLSSTSEDLHLTVALRTFDKHLVTVLSGVLLVNSRTLSCVYETTSFSLQD